MTAEIKDYTKIAVTVEVENTGKYVTDEVVQIYVTKDSWEEICRITDEQVVLE